MMDQIFQDMMKRYIEAYSKTEEFQKGMLLSMLNIFNNKNLEEAITRDNQDPFNSSLKDIKHISKELSIILNQTHNTINIEQCKVICGTVLNITKLLEIAKTTTISTLDITEKIDLIYEEISLLNIRRRALSKEEFLSIEADEYDNQESFDNLFYTPLERASESRLKKYGYSVAWDSPLSTKKRQELLQGLIESGKVSRGYVISYLKHNIQINGKKESNEFAVMKWKEDLDFVYKL